MFSSLINKDDLFQSGFWAYFKSFYEKDSLAFIVSWREKKFPLVLLIRQTGNKMTFGYCPRAPQIHLHEEEQGPFLENLAAELKVFLPRNASFIRFDTVWESPYDCRKSYAQREWDGPPRDRLREIRMNYFTEEKNLRKSKMDMMPPYTVLLDLNWDEDELFMDMRPNTRNCIRKARKKGVTVQNASIKDLPRWYEIYADTALRKGFQCIDYDYFDSLFSSVFEFRFHADNETVIPRFHLLLATEAKDILSGMILGIHGNTAYYLYAGSSLHKRDHMPNYRLQWEAIRIARNAGCHTYDLFGVPSTADSDHQQHGLFRFKTGFGGKIVHNRGCWDYPLNDEEYFFISNIESASA